jgi:undecaprenyl-diphosphatase
MSYIQSLLLGILQGLTEFLPVSSSGHLVILEHLLKTPSAARMAVVAVLHIGTALALIVYFRAELARIFAGMFSRTSEKRSANWKIAGYVALASIPAGVVGLLARHRIEAVFSSPGIVGPMLLVTGAFVLATRLAPERGRQVGWLVALFVGLAQAVAIMPGISRSGATVAAALFLGLDRDKAFEFSFILSVPIVLIAAVKELLDVNWTLVGAGGVAVGVVAAFVFGLGALVLLRRAVISRRFFWFGFYCLAAGLAALLFVR